MGGPLFNRDRPADIREARPWHRYAHYIDVLPKALENLAHGIELPESPSILDYGCADLPYRRLFPTDAEYVPADLPGNPDATLTLNQDGTVPCEDERFDLVVSTQVLEHVGDPDRYLSECRRVLRPGGLLLLSTHGVFVYHPDPVDYWRWTCAGLRRVVEGHGFEIQEFRGAIGLAATGIQLVQDALYWHLPVRLRPALALVSQALIRLVDRLQGEDSKALNASVFLLVGRRA